jgi:hypothetical protein
VTLSYFSVLSNEPVFDFSTVRDENTLILLN